MARKSPRSTSARISIDPAPVPKIQQHAIYDHTGARIRFSHVIASSWVDPDDNDPNRRIARKVQGYKAPDIIERFYLDAIRTSSGRAIVPSDALIPARHLSELHEISLGARPNADAGIKSQSGLPGYGPSERQLDAVRQLNAVLSTMPTPQAALIRRVIADNYCPRIPEYDLFADAVESITLWYETTFQPRFTNL